MQPKQDGQLYQKKANFYEKLTSWFSDWFESTKYENKQRLIGVESFLMYFVSQMNLQKLEHGFKVMLSDIGSIFYNAIYWVFHLPRRLKPKLLSLFDERLWAINAWVVGTTALGIGVGLVLANLEFNMQQLQLWAHGNVFLIMSTLFITYQFLFIVPLAYELDFILNLIRPVRALNVILNSIYSSVYFAFLSGYIVSILRKQQGIFDQTRG